MTADSSWQRDAGPGLWLTDTEPASVDTQQLRAGRLARLRDMMREKDYAGLLLFDPFNQRYATGSRNMFGYFLRNSTRYFFVPTEGPVILFEYPQSAHVSTGLETVQEARHSKIVWSSVAGRDAETARPFAQEISRMSATSAQNVEISPAPAAKDAAPRDPLSIPADVKASLRVLVVDDDRTPAGVGSGARRLRRHGLSAGDFACAPHQD